MNVFNKLLLLTSAVVLLQCQKDRDQYFERSILGGKPIYEVLEDEGRFGLFLQCVERSAHAENFKGNGYWTVFAPNDEAMSIYLSQKSYASVAEVPTAEVEKIVAYSMLFTKYPFDRLTAVLSGGWDTLKSVKKKTPYYETLHKESYKGAEVWVANPTGYTSFSLNDNNYKYMPMYLARNFSGNSSDYETFYPRPYTGRNVQGASIYGERGRYDMEAANGIIHEVDRVNEPLPNLEDLLKDNSYSKYRELLDFKNAVGEPYYYQYLTSEQVKSYYQNMYPDSGISELYIKFYNVPYEFLRPGAVVVDAQIAIPLNVERFFMSPGEEGGGYTLFAPTNTAVEKFEQDVLSHYADAAWARDGATVINLPTNVRRYFINAHMRQYVTWPSSYKTARNVYENFINGEGSSGYDFDNLSYPDLKVASNGLFYGSKNYIKTHWFESVLTEVLLRPDRYRYMYNALNSNLPTLMEDFIRCPLFAYPDNDYAVLLLSDDLLGRPEDGFPNGDGFSWVWSGSTEAFAHSNTVYSAQLRIERLVRSHTFKRVRADRVDFMGDPGGPYNGYAYAVNDYGDMVRYKNNQLQMLGN